MMFIVVRLNMHQKHIITHLVSTILDYANNKGRSFERTVYQYF